MHGELSLKKQQTATPNVKQELNITPKIAEYEKTLKMDSILRM